MIIGDKAIGAQMRPQIIAEIGINHNGSIDLAKKMIDSVVNCGADFVKFQHCPPEQFDSSGTHNGEKIYDIFKRTQFTIEQWIEIKEFCDEFPIPFFATTVSVMGVREMKKIGACAFKVSSDMINNVEMIGEMRRKRLPIIISTGRLGPPYSSLGELKYKAGPEDLILHCESTYPCEFPKLWKIRAIQDMGYTVGYSNHVAGQKGVETCVRVTELGAVAIETHVTLSHDAGGVDSSWSLDPTELQQLVRAVK